MSAREKIRIICISDTHGYAPGEGYVLPKGDILIHAGDLTNQGSLSEVQKATTWLSKLDYAAKIVVAGNHDLSLDQDYAPKYSTGWKVTPTEVGACRDLVMRSSNFVYLQHSGATVNVPGKDVALRVFGSPYSPDRGKQNWAFQYHPSAATANWEAIEADTDIVITHTPPAGVCDRSLHWDEGGCSALLAKIRQIKPLLHVTGHCHEGRGAAVINWNEDSTSLWVDPSVGSKKLSRLDLTAQVRGVETAVVNASVMARSYGRGAKAFNKAMLIDLLV